MYLVSWDKEEEASPAGLRVLLDIISLQTLELFLATKMLIKVNSGRENSDKM